MQLLPAGWHTNYCGIVQYVKALFLQIIVC